MEAEVKKRLEEWLELKKKGKDFEGEKEDSIDFQKEFIDEPSYGANFSVPKLAASLKEEN